MGSLRHLTTQSSKPSQPVGDDHDNKPASSKNTDKRASNRQGNVLKSLKSWVAEKTMSKSARAQKKNAEASQKNDHYLAKAIDALIRKAPKEVYACMETIAANLDPIVRRESSKKDGIHGELPPKALWRALFGAHLKAALPHLTDAEFEGLEAGIGKLVAPGNSSADALTRQFVRAVKQESVDRDKKVSAAVEMAVANPGTIHTMDREALKVLDSAMHRITLQGKGGPGFVELHCEFKDMLIRAAIDEMGDRQKRSDQFREKDRFALRLEVYREVKDHVAELKRMRVGADAAKLPDTMLTDRQLQDIEARASALAVVDQDRPLIQEMSAAERKKLKDAVVLLQSNPQKGDPQAVYLGFLSKQLLAVERKAIKPSTAPVPKVPPKAQPKTLFEDLDQDDAEDAKNAVVTHPSQDLQKADGNALPPNATAEAKARKPLAPQPTPRPRLTVPPSQPGLQDGPKQ